ncbi:MAG: hypothetical protein FWF84_02145, partial [Kiritimatiellaeota bacterium]|nr:hypothetical protein [Kiritimatiellota bacterium]
MRKVIITFMVAVTAIAANAATYYVDASRPNDTGAGTSWATAKRTIQAAVDIAGAGDGIVVTNGTYAPIKTANKAIAISSVNGAAATVIDGGGTSRCASLGTSSTQTNTVLSGFTLTNGLSADGAGAHSGTLNHCVVSGNTSTGGGGGACASALNHCTVSGNVAATTGGGTRYCRLTDCTVSGNTASQSGGGAYFSTLNNCTVSGNTSERYGGGVYEGTLNNCAVFGNRANDGGGGGAFYGTLNNCTVSGNTAAGYYGSGGTYYCTINNSIVWGNAVIDGTTTNYNLGTFRYSCAEPVPMGGSHVMNIGGDPLFRLPEAGDYRLMTGSPCLDAGTNDDVVGATDILGNARIQNGTVDMGAYEGAGTLRNADWAQNLQATVNRTDGILVSWEPPASGDAVLYRVCRHNPVTGQWEPVSDWIAETAFLATQMPPHTDYDYAVLVAFDANLDEISTLSAPATGRRLSTTYYVDASHTDDQGDALSWATAKRTIQGGITLAAPG